MTSRRVQLLFLGVSVSVVFLYLALRGMNWNALGETLRRVQVGGLALCFAMIALGIVLRGWRWCLITGPNIRVVSNFVRAINLGILGNQLLPARLGEVVRIVALMRILKKSLSETVSSALIDRIFDAFLLFFSALLVSTSIARAYLPQGWLIGLGVALAILVVCLLVSRTHSFHVLLVKWSERYLHRWSLRPASFIKVFHAMMERLANWRIGGLVVIVGLLVWLADYFAVMAALWSVGLNLPVAAPLLLWVMLAAGSALPSAPGYVGIYQFAAVLSLATYGVPAYQAVAVSLVLQSVALLTSLAFSGREIGRVWSSAMRY